MLDQLVAAVRGLEAPAAVGLSGYGGAGKSTLCRQLATLVPTVAVVAGDDFLDPAGCGEVTDDWGGLDRARIARDLLAPFRRGAPVRWQRLDWASGGLAEWHELPPCEILVVEGIGVLHPDLDWDLTVWLDTPAEVAWARGARRDREEDGVDHDAVWRDVWAPTDAAFVARFRPERTADLVLRD